MKIRTVWHSPYRSSFDLARAKKCTEILSGTHDFLAFRGAFRGNEKYKMQDTVCNIYDISIYEEAGLDLHEEGNSQTFCIEITGDRFLYKQVRLMVGAIIELSSSDRIPEDILHFILNNKQWPDNKGHTSFPRLCAPARGLCLVDVKFDPKWKFQWLYADHHHTRTRNSVKELFLS